ncbi:MAG TPA: glucose-1-phosphate adenylyltransferase subunit GlgD [Clostridia bacterium]|jgi:glucose-1-phosphate adenylyltransferase|nr:glucose-1-phosphate adenylyltransferase subunit GlgD [Clostridiaceae bacterium]HOF27316.1 glucose-1-phosphate adenylyltransferase subunit GlgD [Clostridia bacterium]HOM35070.1 glucose-1-phosphate adenylyltransferase subunit GlgD [Clostridia bacterium]HOR90482.1 glucose-1-phosphate adenylyltransferase subunit GlgD [Clostridia bacterium]HOT71549.1 glucose-1-phosphate adenylyltransferase subunit GlgD [Clostridia bacterium]
MKDALGIIFAEGTDTGFGSLTSKRSLAAVPIASRYRIIDFILSSMVNSGITNVGIITQRNYKSLMDHVGTGKEWDLNRKIGGLLLIPPTPSRDIIGSDKVDLLDLAGALGFLERSPQKYVVLSKSHLICNLNFTDAFEKHVNSNAIVTILYQELEPEGEISGLKNRYFLTTDENDKITQIKAYSSTNESNKISLDIYIINKDFLIYLIRDGLASGERGSLSEVFARRVEHMKMIGYVARDFVARIDSIKTFYQANMVILQKEIREKLFFEPGRIYTKVKDEAPSKYMKSAVVKNSLIADGCVIDGYVENSIIFRGVKVVKGARVTNSIIMQGSEIQENATLEHVILDKEVIIRQDIRLTGQKSYLVLIDKGAIV